MSPSQSRDEQHLALEAKLRAEARDDLAQVLADCRAPLLLSCLCCRARIEVTKGCAKRWCPTCGPHVTAKRYRRFIALCDRFDWPLSVCLTRANTSMRVDALDEMKRDFRSFRRTRFWTATVRGGVAGFEITHRGRGLHPHLHALIDCRWLAVETPPPQRGHSRAHVEALCKRAQRELSEVWGAYVQGRAASVWVQRVARAKPGELVNALAETLKYAVKTADLLRKTTRASAIIDQIDAGRAVTTFGHAHACAKDFVGLDLPEPPPKLCKACNAAKSLFPADIAEKLTSGKWPATRRIERLIRRGDILADAAALGIDPDQWDAHLARFAQNTRTPATQRD